MPQVYFLSIIANLLTGLLLAADYLGQKVAFFAEWRKLLQNRTAEITLGIAVAVIGVIKLIVFSPGEHVAVVGDLLPGLMGLVLGAVLLGQAFRSRVEKAGPKADQVARVVIGYQVPIGIAGMVVATLHFLFPQVLFL
jgi:hypothetical protein